MRKRRLKLVAKIPNYVPDGVAWRRAIYKAVTKAQRDAGVQYSDADKLDVEVCFHLHGHKLTKLDLDNRLKAVGDALQGFINREHPFEDYPPDSEQPRQPTSFIALSSRRFSRECYCMKIGVFYCIGFTVNSILISPSENA